MREPTIREEFWRRASAQGFIDYSDPIALTMQPAMTVEQVDDVLLAMDRSGMKQSKGPTPGKNVLETVEQYRREHPGAIERAEAEMIAEEAGLYDYTCPHCFTVFRAIYGQDFPNCPYCAKQLTWWPPRPSGIQQALQPTPIPMWLKCPYCFATHIDRDEWATRPHKTHLCEYCGIEWRPAEVYTVGIEPWDKALNP